MPPRVALTSVDTHFDLRVGGVASHGAPLVTGRLAAGMGLYMAGATGAGIIQATLVRRAKAYRH